MDLSSLTQLAQMAEVPAWLEWIERGGVLALLLIIIIGGSKRLWVWGWQQRETEETWEQRYREMETDRNFWRDVALRSVDITEAVAGRRKP